MVLFTGVGMPENKKFRIRTNWQGKYIYLYYVTGQVLSPAWVFDISNVSITSDYFRWTATRNEDISGRRSYYIHPVVAPNEMLTDKGEFSRSLSSAGDYATKEINEDLGKESIGLYRLLYAQSTWRCVRVGQPSMITQFPDHSGHNCDGTDYVWEFVLD